VVAFLTYVQQFFRPIQLLSSFYAQAQAAVAAAERIFQLLDEEPRSWTPPERPPRRGGRRSRGCARSRRCGRGCRSAIRR